MIGWWSSANAEKQATQRAQRAEGESAGLRERLVAAEKQIDWYRSRETHPSFRRVK